MKERIVNGAATSGTAQKFWNVASVSGDEGEITLYGDVMSQQPVDWWTGEPEPGMYITPEGFMDDLAAVRGKPKITVKLNSCGGDLYTGIAIHNALKSLGSQVNVVVEGIAASAASVIMCAGDTVTVYPGSLIMIHGVSIMLWDWLDIPAMKQLIKGMDASERAVAEIYSTKTGTDVDMLRGMMTKETWMTGREAIEKGFADSLNEDMGQAARVSMSMSADKRKLIVNGISHNVEGMRNIPQSIPVSTIESDRMQAAEAAADRKGEEEKMDLNELESRYPDLVGQLRAKAAADEQARLKDIESIEAAVGDPDLVAAAKYGPCACGAAELSLAALKKAAQQNALFLGAMAADAEASGAGRVGAAAVLETVNTKPSAGLTAADEADIQNVVSAYSRIKGGSGK